ncbi:MAG: hypothetical protein CL920_10710 [Deltaproteobacteria bacterium]|nr:hypothetical protein [Deltaproteobacteria bacterium]MBU49157.1 hypothetical protein [Deltaproteobacteria bacterium]
MVRMWIWCIMCLCVPALTWAQTGADPAPTRPDVKPEQVTVYVPYQKIGKLLQKEGIFLTKLQYHTLKNELAQLRAKTKQRAPIASFLQSARYEGTVNDNGVRLHATLTLQLMEKDRWAIVPIPFSGLPLLSAKLDNKPAYLFTSGHPKRLFLLARGKGSHSLQLSFAGPVLRRSASRAIHFQIPSTPQTHVRISFAGSGWQLVMNGQKTPLKLRDDKKSMLLDAQLGPQRNLQLNWFPKQDLGNVKKTLYSAKIQVESTIEDGLNRSIFQVNVHVLRGKTQELKLSIPKAHKLIAVEGGRRLKQWFVLPSKVKGTRILRLRFHKAWKGRQLIRLECERILPKKERALEVPMVSVLGAQWQHGGVGLYAGAGLQLKVTGDKGLMQMDASEYATQYRTSVPEKAYTFIKPGFSLRVALQKIKPRVRAELAHFVELDGEQATLHTKATFKIERAGVFRFRFQLPQGWELRDVKCPMMQDYFIEEKAPKHLVVVFKQKVGGPKTTSHISPSRLWTRIRRVIGWHAMSQMGPKNVVVLRKRLRSKNAVAQLEQLFVKHRTQASGAVVCRLKMRRALGIGKALALPLPRPLGLENEKGVISLSVPSHLELRSSKLKSLMTIDQLDQLPRLSGLRFATRQAFRYAVRPASGEVILRKKATAIETKIWLPVTMREDGFRLEGRIRFRVRFAGTKTLHFTAPKAWMKQLQITSNKREVHKKVVKDRVEYELVLERKVPRDGYYDLTFVVQERFKKTMKIGEAKQLTLTAISTPKAFRQTVYWGLKKDESLSLAVIKKKGFQRVDASDLPGFVSKKDMSHYLSSRDKTLSPVQIAIRKHQYAEVLSAVVPRLHLDAVLNSDGDLDVLALLRVQNRGRQFLKLKLPKGAKVLGMRVAHKDRYRFELDKKGELLIDLAQQTSGKPFIIAVRYQYKPKHSAGHFKINGPLVLDTPVLQSTMRTYLPPRYSYTHFATSMWHRYNTLGLWSLLRDTFWGRELRRLSSYPSDEYSLISGAPSISRKMPRRGRTFRFYGQKQQIHLTISYRRSIWQGIFEFAIFLLVFFVMIGVERRQSVAVSAIQWVFGSIVLLVVLGAFLPGDTIQFTYAAFLGVLTAATYWMGFGFYHFLETKVAGDDDTPPFGFLSESDDDDSPEVSSSQDAPVETETTVGATEEETSKTPEEKPEEQETKGDKEAE